MPEIADLFAEKPPKSRFEAGQAPSRCLEACWLQKEPTQWRVAADWLPVLERFASTSEWTQLRARLAQASARGAVIYPPEPARALECTPLARVRVVVLGQDPYHGAGQAEGLAFSVATGQKLPPSLRNIMQEVVADTAAAWPLDASGRPDGSLVRWAEQGVLLLNSCWTVEEGQAASHANWGWEALTRAVLQAVAAREAPCVWMLWGAHAQRLVPEHLGRDALVLRANHPSPLAARRPPVPFIGCGHFSAAQAYWQARGQTLLF